MTLALLDAIRADPEDAAPQLVIADWLLAQDDARGELIVLDHFDRATPGGLGDDVDALERLLFLAAEYTFPCVRDPEPLLAFRSPEPNAYECEYAGRFFEIYFDYGYGDSDVAVAPRLDIIVPDGGCNFFAYDGLQLPRRDVWSADEALVIFRILSDAIQTGSPLDELLFPWMDEPLPVYEGGPLRVYRLPHECLLAYRLPSNRYGLAARDYHRWHKLWRRLAALRRR